MKPTICSTATFDLNRCNAGPFFLLGEQIIHPTQVQHHRGLRGLSAVSRPPRQLGGASVRRHAAERRDHRPCPADIIGIHTYCRDDVLEIIDARYRQGCRRSRQPSKPFPKQSRKKSCSVGADMRFARQPHRFSGKAARIANGHGRTMFAPTVSIPQRGNHPFMKTIVIPQFYRGPSGQKGLYNRQEVGFARAFAALGCRAVVTSTRSRALKPPGSGPRSQT